MIGLLYLYTKLSHS